MDTHSFASLPNEVLLPFLRIVDIYTLPYLSIVSKLFWNIFLKHGWKVWCTYGKRLPQEVIDFIINSGREVKRICFLYKPPVDTPTCPDALIFTSECTNLPSMAFDKISLIVFHLPQTLDDYCENSLEITGYILDVLSKKKLPSLQYLMLFEMYPSQQVCNRIRRLGLDLLFLNDCYLLDELFPKPIPEGVRAPRRLHFAARNYAKINTSLPLGTEELIAVSRKRTVDFRGGWNFMFNLSSCHSLKYM